MEPINKNIKLVIYASDLEQGTKYTMHLWDKAHNSVIEAESEEYDLLTGEVPFSFTEEQTAKLIAGSMITLEIYDSNKKQIFTNERFRRVRETSVNLEEVE